MKVTQFLLAAGILAAASSAHAGVVTYDFNGFADGTSLSGLDLGGITFDGGTVNGGAVSSATPISGVFSMFGVINISLDINGTTSLTAFAPGNIQIGFDDGDSGSLSMFAPNTYSISISSAGTFDNLIIESIDVAVGSGPLPGGAAVPVPAALPLMATALAGVAYLGTRHRK